MYLKSLELKNFKNYESLNIELNKGINILCGKNAQGKTNLLESIYVLGLTKTHSFFNDNNIIMNDKDFCYVKGLLSTEKVNDKLEILINPLNKKLKINNNEVKKVSDYISKMNIISFYPTDLEIITSSPNIRRKYLNLELSQLYNSYFKVLVDYNKLLKIRNDYIKKMQKNVEIDQNYFDIITDYLIDKAIFIYKARNKFINKINENCSTIYKKITNIEGFNIKYASGLENYETNYIKDYLKDKYNRNKQREIKFGTTLYGPHRDNIEFYIGDSDLKSYGSQGQKRVAVITLKLAEIEIFKNYAKTPPILLLDDVFSELDNFKKNKILGFIKNNIQTIITVTDINDIKESKLKNAKVFYIKEGKVIREVFKNGRKTTL